MSDLHFEKESDACINLPYSHYRANYHQRKTAKTCRRNARGRLKGDTKKKRRRKGTVKMRSRGGAGGGS